MGSPAQERISEVRAFNRFYTRLIGALGDHLASPFSLAQVRVLYELAHQDAPVASDLCEELALDPGYLSRMLRALEDEGLVTSRPSKSDARRRQLELTAKGKRMFAALERKADDAVAALLEPVPAQRQREITAAMQQIRAALEAGSGAAPEPGPPFVVRTHRSGDLGWILHRHGVLYSQEYGWGDRFEALVARIIADFSERHDPERERCWVAEREGAIVGSIMLVTKSKHVAQLRLLYVEPTARGHGIGKRLVAECTRFAREADYRKIMLWTNSALGAARKLYLAEGYRLVEEAPSDVPPTGLAQTWELTL